MTTTKTKEKKRNVHKVSAKSVQNIKGQYCVSSFFRITKIKNQRKENGSRKKISIKIQSKNDAIVFASSFLLVPFSVSHPKMKD